MIVEYAKAVVLAVFISGQSAVVAANSANVWLEGEPAHVVVPLSWASWRVVDIDGKQVHRGSGAGDVSLGKLPPGYYELRQADGAGLITAVVLPKAEFADDTPIAIDAAMSWFYSDPQQIRDACRLCRLAGVKWVRDRASWPELENARGVWAGETRYEKAMRIEHEEGLKILQVNHISPSWASKDPKHFPDDLRDVFNFYRGLAKRWKGLADAIEPWNEPDIEVFGGHTGCEIASFQKAAYLGLKAGNPDLPACEAVFAIARPETLEEFGANEVYPYFDIYNLHHYTALPTYPRVYALHRAASGGRPMWTTEFNLTIHWSDEKTKEPSEEDLRIQAYRVSKVFAEALHEGPQKAFYFMLGHYVERNLQYGLVHADLTPRPAYVAFAAVGRLLNAAKPIGRVKFGDEKLKGYLFKTQIHGRERETLVAWSETKKTKIQVSGIHKSYDYLGREMRQTKEFELARAPIFLTLPPNGSKQFKIDVPPAKAPWRKGTASPVVLQLMGRGDVNSSAFRLDATRKLRLVAYNFETKAVEGTLEVEGATPGTQHLRIAAGERHEQSIKVGATKTVTARFAVAGGGTAIVHSVVVTTPEAAK